MVYVLIVCIGIIIATLGYFADTVIINNFKYWPELAWIQPLTQIVIIASTIIAIIVIALVFYILNQLLLLNRQARIIQHLLKCMRILSVISIVLTVILGTTIIFAAQSMHPVLLLCLLVAVCCPVSLIIVSKQWGREF